jgi:hypothetical protein
MYSRDVVFKEVKGTTNSIEVQMDKEPKKTVFELRNKEHDLNASTK